MKNNNQQPWWKGAVIYQIYPRSFCDSNGDGIGDLPGINRKLDYIAGLGVDAIWISPFFTSPMADFGYDISDYRAVDPIFGTIEDFKILLSNAHALGLKVIIDQVLSHTSEQHPWFAESSADRTNAKADWYVWANPNADGSPPNNWLSVFGGSAWQWHPTREQYYLHNFLAAQPDLNFHCAAAREAQLSNVKFWLDLGVDGLRLDVVNFYYHDRQLRPNPASTASTSSKVGISKKNPYTMQDHVYDIDQPENLAFVRQLRELLNRYPATTSIGEIVADRPSQVMTDYTSGDDKLHMAYTFDLLGEESTPQYIHAVAQQCSPLANAGRVCWTLGNHDVQRVATRWGKGRDRLKFSKIAAAMLFSLPGSACVYQGDELGLTEAEIAFEDIVDPYGKAFWPDYKGRDGCRTPMVWNATKTAGFSTAKAWLPVAPAHLPLCVEKQESDPNSMLNFFCAFLRWRKTIPELVNGEITLLQPQNGVLAWLRKSPKKTILAAFNLSDKAAQYPVDIDQIERIDAPTFTGNSDGKVIELAPFDAFFAQASEEAIKINMSN